MPKTVQNPGLAAFGLRLKAIRGRRGVIQCWVAAEAGLSKAFMSDLERGYATPSASTLERLADVLGVTMDELWRGLGRCEAGAISAADLVGKGADRG